MEDDPLRLTQTARRAKPPSPALERSLGYQTKSKAPEDGALLFQLNSSPFLLSLVMRNDHAGGSRTRVPCVIAELMPGA